VNERQRGRQKSGKPKKLCEEIAAEIKVLLTEMKREAEGGSAAPRIAQVIEISATGLPG
jgi:hypothetical protein